MVSGLTDPAWLHPRSLLLDMVQRSAWGQPIRTMISRKKSFNILQPIQMRVSDQNKPVVTVVQGSQFHLLLKQHLLANGPFWDAEQGNIVLLFPYPFFFLDE